mgnify:CR=1 FL=1|jgi:hypothetical protein
MAEIKQLFTRDDNFRNQTADLINISRTLPPNLKAAFADKTEHFSEHEFGYYADRPFSVLAGIGKITALGTAFVVKKTPSDVLVTLIKGRVAVEQQDQMTTITHTPSQPDHIGQQLAYSRKGISKANIVDFELNKKLRE